MNKKLYLLVVGGALLAFQPVNARSHFAELSCPRKS